MKIEGKVVSVEDKKKDGSHLENCLVLSQSARRNNDILRNGNSPQPCNGNFPSDNDDDHPGRNLSRRDERDERSDDQELVCKGIEEFSKGGHHSPASCKIPIECIRNGGSKKEKPGEELISAAHIKKENQDKRNCQNPENRYSIGQAQYLFAIEFFHEGIFDFKLQMADCGLKTEKI